MRKIKKFGDKKLIIRLLEKSDIKRAAGFKRYINDLVDDDTAYIAKKEKVTLKEEREWIKSRLKEIKEKQRVTLIVEDGGKIISTSSVFLPKFLIQKHVAGLGIAVLKDYRGRGLGTYLMREVIKLAKKKLKPKPEMIKFGVFANNKIAVSLYKKMGFRAVAKIPKQFKLKGKYFDEIIMIKNV